MNFARTTISIFIGTMMLAASVGTLGVVAANDDTPDELPAHFHLAAPHVGDRGTYTVTLVQLKDGEATVLEPERPLLSFEWGTPTLAVDGDGVRQRANILKIQYPDDDGPPSTWAYEPGDDRVIAHSFGWLRTTEDGRINQGNLTGPRDPRDDDGVRTACGLYSKLMGQSISLRGTTALFHGCAWGGTAWTDDIDFKPVGPERLGDIDTVLFTKRTTFEDVFQMAMQEVPHAYHVWLNQSTPYPIRMAYSWDAGQYHVFRLANFDRGTVPLATTPERFNTGMPDAQYSTPPTHGIDEAGFNHPFPLTQAIEAARQHDDAGDLASYMQRDTRVVAAEGTALAGDEAGFEWTITLWDEETPFAFTVAQGPEPDAVQAALGATRIQYAEAEAKHEEFPKFALLEEPRPTAASLAQQWRVQTGGAQANTYGFWTMCAFTKEQECKFAHVITWAGHQVRTTTTAPIGPAAVVDEQSRWEDRRWHYVLGDFDHATGTWDPAGKVRQSRALLEERFVGESRPIVLPSGQGTGQSEVPAETETLGSLAPIWSWPARNSAYLGASVAAFGAAALYYFWPALKVSGIGLFSRVQDPQVLASHPVRRRILDAITASPGAHTSALRRTTELGAGSFQHHTQKLIDAGLVTRIQQGGYTCFFLKGSTDRHVMAGASALRSPAARKILAAIVEHPGIAAGKAAKLAGVSPSTASHHIKRLEEAGLIDAQRTANSTMLMPSSIANAGLATIAA